MRHAIVLTRPRRPGLLAYLAVMLGCVASGSPIVARSPSPGPSACPWAAVLTAVDRAAAFPLPLPAPTSEVEWLDEYVDARPHAFGGQFVDHSRRTQTVQVIAGQPEADPAVWAWRMRSPLDLQIVCARHSLAELRAISDRIAAAMPVLDDLGVVVAMVGPDEQENAVRVEVVDPDDRARAIIGAIAGPGAPLIIEAGVIFGSSDRPHVSRDAAVG